MDERSTQQIGNSGKSFENAANSYTDSQVAQSLATAETYSDANTTSAEDLAAYRDADLTQYDAPAIVTLHALYPQNVTHDGSNHISQVTDALGNANVVQAIGASQPVYVPNRWGAVPAMRFDGGQTISSGAFGFGVLPQPVMLACIVEPTQLPSGAGSDTIGTFVASYPGNTVDNIAMFIRPDGTFGAVTSGAAAEMTGTVATPLAPHVLIFVANGATSQFWIDGIEVDTGAVHNPGPGSLGGIAMGDYPTGTGKLHGYVGSVIMCEGAVASAAYIRKLSRALMLAAKIITA